MVNESCLWERKVLLQIYRFRHFKLHFSGEAEGSRRKPQQLYFLVCLWHMLMENCWKFPTVVEEKGSRKHLTTTKTPKETQPLLFPCIAEPHTAKGQFFYGYSFWSYNAGFNLGHSPYHLNSRTTAIATPVMIMKMSYCFKFLPLLSHLLFLFVTSAQTESAVKMALMHRSCHVTWQYCWINSQHCLFSAHFVCVVSSLLLPKLWVLYFS